MHDSCGSPASVAVTIVHRKKWPAALGRPSIKPPLPELKSGRPDSNRRRPAWEGGRKTTGELSTRQFPSENAMLAALCRKHFTRNSASNASRNGSRPSTSAHRHMRGRRQTAAPTKGSRSVPSRCHAPVVVAAPPRAYTSSEHTARRGVIGRHPMTKCLFECLTVTSIQLTAITTSRGRTSSVSRIRTDASSFIGEVARGAIPEGNGALGSSGPSTLPRRREVSGKTT